MSLDPSLRIAAQTAGKRSVMTRAERITKMLADKKFDMKSGKPLGLPKTLVPKG
ncbi:MAG: small basic protein [Phycisphaerales bacterium]|nr:small basic protein [Phycisphaerales bacterium]